MKKVIIAVVSIIVVVASITLVCFLPRNEVVKQDLNYTEITDNILNPHQGFYRTGRVKVGRQSVEDKSYIIKDSFQMYHLRMDISEYSTRAGGVDGRISDQGIIGIESLIQAFCCKDKNIVIRFAYDPEFDGNADCEPSIDIMLEHIAQISSIVNKYPYTITAVEVGLVGPWGEMHTSTMASKEVINLLIDKFLETTQDIPILVRTPQMIYDYLDISLEDIDNYCIDKSSRAYRLGLFNDGYLGSDSDLGTYDDREKEVNWMSRQTEHLPFGGEVAIPTSSLHDIDKCLPEMFLMNLSYLNYEWNDEVVQQKWQSQFYNSNCGGDSLYYNKTAYEYISAHLGYRLVLSNSVFTYNKQKTNLSIDLDITNVGFGEMYFKKDINVLFIKNNEVVLKKNVGKYCGKDSINFDVDISNIEGEFDVYIQLVSTINAEGRYPIRFANDLWNESLVANNIGKISV